VTTVPYWIAAAREPPGYRFTGIFFYQDDVYQYLSFAEQASRGRLLFHNKFDVRPHEPVVVNLEWWAAGWLAAAAGGRLVVGFHVLRVLAMGGVVFGAARLLSLGRIGPRHLLWGVMVFVTAGGLGWWRLWAGVPGGDVPDIHMGLYPFHQGLMNAHFVVGNALLLWTTAFYLEFRSGQGPRWPWVATGSALGLSRPYDLAVFVLVALGLAAADLFDRERRGHAARRALDPLWLVPVLAYYGLLVTGRFGLGGWTGAQSGDRNPPAAEFVWAIAPAAAAAIGFALLNKRRASSGPLLPALLIWWSALMLVVLFYASPMAKQHATSLGGVAVLTAVVLAPPRWLPALFLALAPTSVFLLWHVLHPLPGWFLPADYFAATGFLRSSCRPREVAVAPTDLSLMIAGLTPCSVALGHRALTPGWPNAAADGQRFYDPATPFEWRREYLRRLDARYVALLPGRGSWLGPAEGIRLRLTTPLLEIWEWTGKRARWSGVAEDPGSSTPERPAQQRRDLADQVRRVRGLREMLLEAGQERLLPILARGVRSERQGRHVASAGRRTAPDPVDQVVAVLPGHADVADQDVG
jgi:hypothetical protein